MIYKPGNKVQVLDHLEVSKSLHFKTGVILSESDRYIEKILYKVKIDEFDYKTPFLGMDNCISMGGYHFFYDTEIKPAEDKDYNELFI